MENYLSLKNTTTKPLNQNKMKANELRIGNLVEGIRIGKVKSIFITHFQVDDFDGITLGNSLQLNFKPIPLTEEWLLKLGFKESLLGVYFPYPYNDFELGYFGSVNGSKKGYVITSLVGKMEGIKYVHQLQNLYFALTGEELTFKSE